MLDTTSYSGEKKIYSETHRKDFVKKMEVESQ